MKIRSFVHSALALSALPFYAGAVVIETYAFNGGSLPLTAADGTGSPASDTRTLSGSSIARLTDVDVRVTLTNPVQAGAFNGDYYLSLQHGSGFSVLLNRVGRTAGSAEGYDDNGFDVTFDDEASNGDVHAYRTVLGGPVDLTYTLPLTGSWAPDGRGSSPTAVLGTDARGLLLDAFDGAQANGGWTLQVIDFNGGGVASLLRWELVLTGDLFAAPIPEPAGTAALTALALGAIAAMRRRNAP
jgi:MYXO-CTERM domain-containing protein